MAFWLIAAGLLLLLLRLAFATDGITGCPDRCGDVDIPYPFGIGPNCSRGDGFDIACNTTNSTGAEADGVPAAGGELMLPVAYMCYNSSGNVTKQFDGDVELNNEGVYRISDERNMFVVIGCNTVAWNQHVDSGGKGLYRNLYYAGCVTYCGDSRSAMDGKCAGVGCCHVDIPPELTDNVVTFEQWPRGDQVGFSPCDYAFIVDKEEYRFRRSDLKMELNRRMPVWLDWAIRDCHGNASSVASCPAPEVEKKKPAGYACVSANSECVNSTNGPGYYCNCSNGYEGNPYDKDGCQGRPRGQTIYIDIKLTKGHYHGIPNFYLCQCTDPPNTIH
uniref:Wall-associated receptor kinase galacturonan-binding domain-containing protein n=1 Tax=Oryza meridionalis TaxID=40149 RepID=A0A0E0EV95_9ORYZ